MFGAFVMTCAVLGLLVGFWLDEQRDQLFRDYGWGFRLVMGSLGLALLYLVCGLWHLALTS